VQPRPGERILDIGCGTAEILESLPHVEYLGIDASEAYIDLAKVRYADRGTFQTGDVRELRSMLAGRFDIVLAMGLLHHLDDGQAAGLFDCAYDVLAAGGRLITIDCTLTAKQSPIARWLIRRDRGKNVRTEEQLLNLATRRFPEARASVRCDLLRIPYTHAILSCPKQT
jgi:2-polyprenyl-3-methyl-5-hydroxy-6-metoxy-1,4-benzoquinol methylase